MNKLNANLQKNVRAVKNILSAEDILVFHFETTDGAACAAIYADGICDKDLLGEQVIRPLSSSERGDSIDEVAKKLTSPEVKKEKSIQAIADEVLSGNTALIVDGLDSALIIGVKKIPVRTITEPPTSIAVKGPREGFIEDIKTNMALLRKRLKTGDLQFETLTVGTAIEVHDRRVLFKRYFRSESQKADRRQAQTDRDRRHTRCLVYREISRKKALFHVQTGRHDGKTRHSGSQNARRAHRDLCGRFAYRADAPLYSGRRFSERAGLSGFPLPRDRQPPFAPRLARHRPAPCPPTTLRRNCSNSNCCRWDC